MRFAAVANCSAG